VVVINFLNTRSQLLRGKLSASWLVQREALVACCR